MSLEFVLTSNWVNMKEWKRLNNDCVKADITESFFGFSLKDYFLQYSEEKHFLKVLSPHL